MIIKLHGKQIELSEWQRITASTNQKDRYKNWARRPIIDDIEAPYNNGAVLVVTFYPDMGLDRFCWTVAFYGEHIRSLNEYYNDVYKFAPTFYDDQLEEAKLHVDNFLLKISKLTVFI
jgi:hypothetical protein